MPTEVHSRPEPETATVSAPEPETATVSASLFIEEPSCTTTANLSSPVVPLPTDDTEPIVTSRLPPMPAADYGYLISLKVKSTSTNPISLQSTCKDMGLSSAGRRQSILERICAHQGFRIPDQYATGAVAVTRTANVPVLPASNRNRSRGSAPLTAQEKLKALCEKQRRGRHGKDWARTQLPSIKPNSTIQPGPVNPAHRVGDMPTPLEVYRRCYTREMLELQCEESNAFITFLKAQRGRSRPMFVPEGKPWPPKWVKDLRGTSKVWTPERCEQMNVIFLMLGVIKANDRNMRSLFGSDVFESTPWLKKVTTRREMELFIRTLHFEDSLPQNARDQDKFDEHYRPRNVWKVGKLLELFRVSCT